MTTNEIQNYYRVSRFGEIRQELAYALSIQKEAGIAVDCGCGAGSNIRHLRDAGYVVHAFDIDAEAISICKERFVSDANVFLYQSSFASFNYPSASLVLADASLFFCPADEFVAFFRKIHNALLPNGLFCGSFLGARDTMAGPEFDTEKFWGDVLVLSETQIRYTLRNYNILRFIEYEMDGRTATGEAHHWHLFSVVAQVN